MGTTKFYSRNNWILNLLWRTQFKIVKLPDKEWMNGRCIRCAGREQCPYRYCPCNWKEHLKFKEPIK